jgi:hypothetical protein
MQGIADGTAKKCAAARRRPLVSFTYEVGSLRSKSGSVAFALGRIAPQRTAAEAVTSKIADDD